MKKKIFFLSLILFFLIAISKKTNAFTLVIDPGHGGTDSGAISENGTYESYYTLKISQYLREYLSKYDMNIYLTHEGSTMDIIDRGIYARSKNADLVVSIHLNADAGSNTSTGAEVWVTRSTILPKYNQKCTELGNKILANLTALGIANRGVKVCSPRSDATDVYSDGTRADYYGIICYSMRGCKIDYGVISPAGAVPADIAKGEGVPAIIVEHCFCKGSDFQFLNTDAKLKKLAEADGKAIVDYYNLKLKETLILKDGTWYFVRGNEIDYTTTTLVYYNGNWYYVQNGVLKWGVRTLVNYNGTWYYVNNSTVDWNFTGLCEYNGTEYYIQNGVLKWGVNGSKYINGEWVNLNNSAVVKSNFPDVNTSDWFKSAVDYVYSRGLMGGYTSGENAGMFGPNDQITRGQIVTILYRKEGQPAVSGTLNFIDKNDATLWSAHYYDNAIKWASQNGIVTGYKDGADSGKFLPDKSITREEFAIILQRYAKYKGMSISVSSSLTGFLDYELVSPWAQSGLQWAVAKGIISGDPKTTPPSLKPQGNASRAEAATMITRFCKM